MRLIVLDATTSSNTMPAEGMICHDVRNPLQRSDVRVRKGSLVRAAELEALLQRGVSELHLAVPAPDDVGEDEAATRLANRSGRCGRQRWPRELRPGHAQQLGARTFSGSLRSARADQSTDRRARHDRPAGVRRRRRHAARCGQVALRSSYKRVFSRLSKSCVCPPARSRRSEILCHAAWLLSPPRSGCGATPSSERLQALRRCWSGTARRWTRSFGPRPPYTASRPPTGKQEPTVPR
jgi:hypothetical protein